MTREQEAKRLVEDVRAEVDKTNAILKALGFPGRYELIQRLTASPRRR